MSKASVLGIALIVLAVTAMALSMAFQQIHYWQLSALQASGAEHDPMFGPSLDELVEMAALGAFPSNIPGILRLLTLLAGAALIVTTQNQLRAMKKILEDSTSKSKGHAGA